MLKQKVVLDTTIHYPNEKHIRKEKMSMKKRFLVGVFAVVMMFSMLSTTAIAADVDSGEDEIKQTLETVFDYLNDQETHLHAMETVEYKIPVGENLISVTVENTPIAVGYGIVHGEDSYFDIERGMSYINTTTIKNFYSNSGTIVFKVQYKVWGNDDPGKVRYRLTPTSVSIDVTDPSGCTLIDSSATYNPDYTVTNLIETYGTASFSRIWPLSNLNFSMKVTILSYEEGYVLCRYQYET